jgi:hypothetical protein
MNHEATFVPHLSILEKPQRILWLELDATPDHFTLYGGTAIALRLGHRGSIDFDFFSNRSFDSDQLARTVPFLHDGERVQIEANTLVCRVERGGPVLVSFFGGLGLGQVAPRARAVGSAVNVASLLDLAGTKAAVIQKRAQAKDYLDVDALLQNGIDLPTMLAAGRVIYGQQFNPLITLKALSYFGDVPELPAAVRERLNASVAAVDSTRLPVLRPHAARVETGRRAP